MNPTKMKNISNKFLPALLVGVVVISACNPLNKMAKKAELVKYTVTPNPLEMHGYQISTDIKVKYPEKFFHKKATVEVTPVLQDMDGNDIKAFRTETLIGEAADGDGKKVSYSKGGSISYMDSVEYKDAMRYGQLVIKAVGKFKTKEKAFDPIKIADATITTPLLVQPDDRPIIGADDFKKVLPKTFNAEINYLVNSANVRSSELRDEDIDKMKEWVDAGQEMNIVKDEEGKAVKGADPKEKFVFKSVGIEAYASPEGEISRNENLADDRAKSAMNAVKNILRREGIDAASEDGFYNLKPKGEDWEGFKSLMQKSEIKDKDLIIRILEMYEDKNKREEEIKNLAATYVEVKEEVLPPLRRSQITINAEEKAKTDEEIQALVASDPTKLTVEEMLYAATLTADDDWDGKLAIYQTTEKTYPEDWRGANNVGYVLLLQGKVDEAEAQFNKADKISPNNAVIINNQGVIVRWKGDYKKAKEYYERATSAGNDVKYNMGIVNIIEGDYQDAVVNFTGQNTLNAGLAQILNGDNEAAKKKIAASPEAGTAMAHYMQAIIGARSNDQTMVTSNLKKAIALDGSLKEKAKTDMEFLKYMDAVSSM